jgi:dihydrofolate reductase
VGVGYWVLSVGYWVYRNPNIQYSTPNTQCPGFINQWFMRRVVLGLAVSLDGFIEGPNGEYDWCFTDQDYGLAEFFKGVDTIFMGRKSYDVANQYASTNPEGNPWKDMTTYLFSKTIDKAPAEDVKLVRDMAEVPAILSSPGKDIWLFGGAELTTTFLNAGLVDELWLSVHPILLGSGKPLFQNINGRKHLKLVESKAYETGLVSLKYSQHKP